MFLEIKKVSEGAPFQFTHTMDFSTLDFMGAHPFATPISVVGSAVNYAGSISLDYTAKFSTVFDCDRCLCEIKKDYSQSFSHKIVEKLYNDNPDSEYIIAEDGKVNLDALFVADLLLLLPGKNICKEDCRGLCHKCGLNLNDSACNCTSKEVDPRLAKLLDLLD